MSGVTKTGYIFSDGGVEKDFADVFNMTIPGNQVTGYLSEAYAGKDLGKIFTLGSSDKTTGYLKSGDIDLGSIFTTQSPAPVIQPVTTWCYKTVTITWTSTGANSYTLNQFKSGTLIATYSTSSTSYPVTNLTNGKDYTFTVTAVYDTSTSTSAGKDWTQPATSTYFTSGTGYTPFDDGTNTTFTFNTGGSLTYNCSTAINNVHLLIVAGGGGGGGGYFYSGQGQFEFNGGGGGGGGQAISQYITIPNGTINVTVGSGGGGGSHGGQYNNGDGAPGTLSQLTGTISISASPGLGGKLGTNNGGGNGLGGASGTTTTGGDGGFGQINSGKPYNGTASGYYNDSGYRYSGGGGGGYDFGGGGGNGSGGITATSGDDNGQDGLAPGSGAGGGNAAFGNGGAGKQGIVIFTVPN